MASAFQTIYLQHYRIAGITFDGNFRPPDLWENAVRPVSPRGGPDEPVDEPQFGPRVGRRRGVEFL